MAIRLNGDRADPVNSLQFISTVIELTQIFEPSIVDTDGKMKQFTSDLGLMRGGNTASIGEPAVVIKPYAALKCLIAPSDISTGEACEWVPRS